jgi:uncharacterized protein involved in response to NO
LLLRAVAVNTSGVLAAMFGWMKLSMVLLTAGLVVVIYALRLFESSNRPPKTGGVHKSFPVFVRLAYVWAIVAALLGIWASMTVTAPGIWGASRHALTVGFLAMMVFSIGQRVLPAFSGMRLLFSPWLMFWSLTLLAVGCTLRVTAQILAYQGIAVSAWAWLPISAITEMTAVTLFASNLVVTFALPRQRATQGL